MGVESQDSSPDLKEHTLMVEIQAQGGRFSGRILAAHRTTHCPTAKARLLGVGVGKPAQPQPAGPPLESSSPSKPPPLSAEQTRSQWSLPTALGGETGNAKGERGAREDKVFPFRSSAP